MFENSAVEEAVDIVGTHTYADPNHNANWNALKVAANGKPVWVTESGDVGSGKTIVAFMSALIAIGNGFQACIMTPTEILSYQHYNKFKEFCNILNINVKTLTGSSKASYKKEIKESLKRGEIDLLIGTHLSLIHI